MRVVLRTSGADGRASVAASAAGDVSDERDFLAALPRLAQLEKQLPSPSRGIDNALNGPPCRADLP